MSDFLATVEKLYSLQICGAAISLIASSTIVFVSRKSFLVVLSSGEHQEQASETDVRDKICTPYRRILIGISFVDMLQSLSLVVGPIITPSDSTPWGRGNVASCETFGFLLLMASLAAPLYSVLLTFYFLCKIKYKMSNEKFREKCEKRAYALIWLFVGLTSLAALFTGSINQMPTGSACHVSSMPLGCRDNPDVECERGGQTVLVFIFIYIMNSVLSLLGVVTLLAIICRQILHRESISHGGHAENTSKRWCRFCRLISRVFHRHDDETDNMYMSRMYLSQMLIQALLYTFVYVLTFLGTWISSGFRMFDKTPPVWNLYLFNWWYAFGGALNILVLTRPKIRVLRIQHPDLSWFQSFWLVLKAGVDLPDEEKIAKVQSECNSPIAIVKTGPSSNINVNSSIGSISQPGEDNEPDADVDYLFCCWGLWYTKLDYTEDLMQYASEVSSYHDDEDTMSVSSQRQQMNRGTSLRSNAYNMSLKSIVEEGVNSTTGSVDEPEHIVDHRDYSYYQLTKELNKLYIIGAKAS
ncbi:hypothetical protein CTEN210_06660 [Chaetoceros tenuissimus]|uniref:G-protein coupled receptors family 1 profile domain-containing protein n=1 Tax=Chaetoceros tenuissimus TaxID=426638 RepID=A0AAD3CQY6_9STRA|nr:hypothetical protein CTEN210_06660 [Chaetoceros tenuissimus]